MTFQLRPYQQSLLCDVQDGLAAEPNGRLMLQLPTGGGKTVIAGALLAAWLQDGRKAVWLTHRKELAEQTQGMLTDAGVRARANVNWTPDEGAPAMAGGAVILMAQKVGLHNKGESRVWNRYDANDLLVIDEAHHAAADGWTRAMQQWPGPIVGMTATPWRLSEKEGFDHLFGDLLCGPQTADLQSLGSLCDAQVFIPPPEERIAGGAVDRTGDYNERGIEQANRDRPDIMTAGALAFWQEHAADRQTIAYAVSVDHAKNLAAVFNDAGIPAAVILGDTSREERDRAIAGFQDGSIRVLVNVIVATEGFDLPDAHCIVITRPTMSLTLYLQMVGRGMRPKPGGGDCLILDLAGNAVTHGLPEQYREWSLKPRGVQNPGESPIVWCPLCETVSLAASQNCQGCGAPYGKGCARCGKWRAWKRWQYENHCGESHQLVCDHCHVDVHIQLGLTVEPPLDTLHQSPDANTANDIGYPFLANDFETADRLTNDLYSTISELFAFVKREKAFQRNAVREIELNNINRWESLLVNDDKLDKMFNEYIRSLPEDERPTNPVQERRIFSTWEQNLKDDLDNCRDYIEHIDDETEWDNKMMIRNVNSVIAYAFDRATQDAGILSDTREIETSEAGDEYVLDNDSQDEIGYDTATTVQHGSSQVNAQQNMSLSDLNPNTATHDLSL